MHEFPSFTRLVHGGLELNGGKGKFGKFGSAAVYLTK